MPTHTDIFHQICDALCQQYGLTYDPSDPTAPTVTADALIVWPSGPAGWPYYFPFAESPDTDDDFDFTGLPDMLDCTDLLPDADFTITAENDFATRITFD